MPLSWDTEHERNAKELLYRCMEELQANQGRALTSKGRRAISNLQPATVLGRRTAFLSR